MKRHGVRISILGLLVAIGASALAQEGVEALLGSWTIETAVRDRTVTSTLTISRAEDGSLAATWKDRRGESALQDVRFDKGKLYFKRVMTTPRGEFALDYEVWVKEGALHGKVKTPRGSRDLVGKRLQE